MQEDEEISRKLREISQRFRERWSFLDAPDLEAYLEEVPSSLRLRLLILLIQDSMELSISQTTREIASMEVDENDCRVETRLELFLVRFPEIRSSFEACRDLVLFEFAIRRGTRSPFEIEHYLELFPEYATRLKRDLVRTDHKLVSTSLMPDRFGPSLPGDLTVADTVGEPLQAWRLPKQIGHFQLLSLLGRGGMGTVFRALDLRTGGVCAVKVMQRTDSWSVYRFNEEFRAVASLDHPNIAKLYESFSEDGIRYFSMELIEGSQLNVWWTRNEAHHFALAQQILGQIALAIQFLHHRGITHGDIKPGNVMVTRRGRAVLLDLGLATFIDDSIPLNRQGISDKLVGTLNYMAPEVIEGSPVTRESDWFSFGAIMWELYTGHPLDIAQQERHLAPQERQPDSVPNSDRANLLRNSILNDPESLRAKLTGANVPEHLKDLCLELLQVDPALRPRSTSIVQRLNLQPGASRLTRKTLSNVPFVGRTAELEQLGKLTDLQRVPLSKLVLIEGEQGEGKTRLVEEWLRLRGIFGEEWVVRASSNFKDSAPLRLINSLVQSFVGHWIFRNEPKLEASSSLLKISEFFPQFSQIIRHDGNLNTARDAFKGGWKEPAQAFIEFIVERSQENPVLLVIDDVQYADDASIELLMEIWNGRLPFRGITVATCSNSESAGSAVPQPRKDYCELIKRTDPTFCYEKMVLESLPLADATQLAHRLLTQQGMPIQATSDLAQGLAEISRGKPSLLKDLIQSLLESDPTGEHWRVKIEEMRGQDVEHFRFKQLRKESRQIVEFLAVARVPVSFQQLQIASRVGPELLFPYLGELAAQNWIEWHGIWPDLRLGILDPSLQIRVQNWTAPDRIQRRHARLAQALVLEVDKQWLEIAYHFAQAGKISRAVDAYLEAANHASKSGLKAEMEQCIEAATGLRALNPAQLKYVMQMQTVLQQQAEMQVRPEATPTVSHLGTK